MLLPNSSGVAGADESGALFPFRAVSRIRPEQPLRTNQGPSDLEKSSGTNINAGQVGLESETDRQQPQSQQCRVLIAVGHGMDGGRCLFAYNHSADQHVHSITKHSHSSRSKPKSHDITDTFPLHEALEVLPSNSSRGTFMGLKGKGQ